MTQRIEWVDSAKGVAIVMIAFHHTLLLLAPFDLADPRWAVVRDVFATFPMPLFFLASGLLARRVMTESWRTLWRHTLLPLAWLYVIWSLLRFGWFTAVPLESRPEETSWLDLALSPLLPQSGLWYLHALFLALVVARALRDRLPPALQVVLAAAASVLFFGPLSTGNLGYEGLLHYLVFFLVGLHAGRVIVALVERSGRWVALTALVCFAAALVLVRLLVLQWLPVVPLLLSALSVTAGVLALASAPRSSSALGLNALGRRTLPVYVTHVIVIAGLTRLLLLLPDGPPPWLEVAIPPLVVATAVTISLLLAAGLARTPLRLLYRPPSRWTTADRRPDALAGAVETAHGSSNRGAVPS
ncbi:acyltransferase [Pseudokineococcus marinus]|uniref:Acyltransferase n=1 Tax=Pseudokineococcus marinus TaxID=351215 RepID=A0A849BH46_9ACTN|nr:acyltransferase [Pseudokineococcus marinus]NNH21891.1 acyltransferase [Pseudokineococcus marinus]